LPIAGLPRQNLCQRALWPISAERLGVERGHPGIDGSRCGARKLRFGLPRRIDHPDLDACYVSAKLQRIWPERHQQPDAAIRKTLQIGVISKV
jgi:hypothetical protein